MTAIQNDCDIVTLINVFHVKPENQQALVDLLIEATERTIQHQPGFISANIHKSYDGRRVVNYAQWQSRDHFEAMLKSQDAMPHMNRAAELAESYDPILCEVVSVHHL